MSTSSTSYEAQKEGETSSQVQTQNEIAPSLTVHHSATFSVELLLDEKNHIYSSHILHVQSRLERTRSDWPEDEILGFMIESAGIVRPSEELVDIDAESHQQNPNSTSEFEKTLSQEVTKPQQSMDCQI